MSGTQLYETANSTYVVNGLYIRAARGGNEYLGEQWRRARAIEDNGRVLIVQFLDGTGFVTSAIRSRVA
jgi:hypothetical protein